MRPPSQSYLFILSPPYAGSTVLWRLLATSPNVSTMPVEGQYVDSAEEHLRKAPWNESHHLPWLDIKKAWEMEWDLGKPILLEKSPPHLIRAAEIEAAFEPSAFIIMMRNPYAFCEGFARRRTVSMGEAAAFWVRCARHQMANIDRLKRTITLSYEYLCDNTGAAVSQLMAFLPQLDSLSAGQVFSAQSVISYEARKIKNFNPLKIKLLSNRDLAEINQVLESDRDLLDYFGYKLLRPSAMRNIVTLGGQIQLRGVRAVARFKRVAKRLVPGAQPEG